MRALALSLFLASITLAAQTKDNDLAAPIRRDAAAIAVLQRATNALGVPQLLNKGSAVATGQFLPDSQSAEKASDFVWKCVGSDCRSESTNATGEQSVVVNTKDLSTAQIKGRQTQVGRHVTMALVQPFFFAQSLQTRLQDQRFSLAYDGQKSLNGKAADVITITLLQHGEPLEFMAQRWFVDPSTGLPLRVEYQIPDFADANWLIPAAFEFSKYTLQAGVAIPSQVLQEERGKVVGTAILKSVTFDAPLSINDITSVGGSK